MPAAAGRLWSTLQKESGEKKLKKIRESKLDISLNTPRRERTTRACTTSACVPGCAGRVGATAHAYNSTMERVCRQACERCGRMCYAWCMWKNTSERTSAPEAENSRAWHHAHRCERCRRGRPCTEAQVARMARVLNKQVKLCLEIYYAERPASHSAVFCTQHHHERLNSAQEVLGPKCVRAIQARMPTARCA